MRPVVALVLMLFPVVALSGPRENIDALLSSFHQAAADADAEAYFAAMTPGMVFLGTDATERWVGQEFRDFAGGHFADGNGWTYVATARNIDIEGGVAWFDELLDHDKLGQCRGSGVALLQDGEWRIAQYNLSVPVPNDMVYSVAQQIEAGEAVAPAAPEAVVEEEVIEELEEEKSAKCRRKRHKTNSRGDC